jgi:ElaB/YqjD/DUF883 family membrane-anchored ribosome-binding protein
MADGHSVEHSTTRRPSRATKIVENLRTVVSAIVVLVLFILLIKSLMSGSQEELDKVPRLVKQIADAAAAAVKERPWQNVTV